MKKAILTTPGNILLEEMSLPDVLNDYDVVLDVSHCGICGTDLKLYKGQGPFSLPGPAVLGHEIAARVHLVGKKVQFVSPGDRVVVNPLDNAIGLGGLPGAFAKYIYLPGKMPLFESGQLYKLPVSLSDELATLTEPLAVALHGVKKVLSDQSVSKEKVFLSGAGPIGLCALMVFRIAGVQDIVVAEPNPYRRQLALRMGAGYAFDPRSEDVHTVLSELHGSHKAAFVSGALPNTNILVECSGNPVALQTVTAALGENRKLLVLAAGPGSTVDVGALQARGGQLITSIVYRQEFGEAIN
ncbi:MAG: alcohol dehydrogenase catalytic domain-containing protein, partial [Bacteroidota bacterium]